jgi:hypothetical protein
LALLLETIFSISSQLMTAKKTYADLRSESFLYALLDEGIQTTSP